VQTFLPYADFFRSAASLDYRRLGKQRVETYQILRCLRGLTSGWSSHPAVQMWRGYEDALVAYGTVMCCEWLHRGYKDTCLGKIQSLISTPGSIPARIAMPGWLGDTAIHLSHRSNLVRKDPTHYAPIFPDVDPSLPYVWPVTC
jgi:hypothetical protein